MLRPFNARVQELANGDFPNCSKMAAKAKQTSDELVCRYGHVLALNDLYSALRLKEEDVLSVMVTGSHLLADV